MTTQHPCHDCPPLRAGFEAAWNHCLEAITQHAARFLRRTQHTLIEVSDVVNETYARALTYWDSLRRTGRYNPCGVLYRITFSSMARLTDGVRPNAEITPEMPDRHTSGFDDRVIGGLDTARSCALLEAGMRQLKISPRLEERQWHRTIEFIRTYGLTQPEIARRMHTNDRQVRRWRDGGFAYLRRYIERGEGRR